jgi:hypothetical protein
MRKVQMNVMVLPETQERIKQMAQEAFRGLGDQVDWMVNKLWLEEHGQAEEKPCEEKEG